jgi:hypothetical protein
MTENAGKDKFSDGCCQYCLFRGSAGLDRQVYVGEDFKMSGGRVIMNTGVER